MTSGDNVSPCDCKSPTKVCRTLYRRLASSSLSISFSNSNLSKISLALAEKPLMYWIKFARIWSGSSNRRARLKPLMLYSFCLRSFPTISVSFLSSNTCGKRAVSAFFWFSSNKAFIASACLLKIASKRASTIKGSITRRYCGGR